MKLIFFLSFVTFVTAEKRRFDGCEVWEVTPRSTDELLQVQQLFHQHNHESEDELMFWDEPGRTNEELSILVCGQGKSILQDFSLKHHVSAKQLDINFQRDLDAQWARYEARHSFSTLDYDEDDYNTLEDIMAQLDVLQASCPSGVTCTVEEVGSSYEGRPMKMFRMTKEGEGRRAIWMDSLVHCREWLAGTTNMGILTRLVTEYGTNEEATRLVDKYDWHFMPVANPDGYSYTWTDDRLWRKSRSPNEGETCMGTDLNRNHNFMWGTPGSSTLPCSGTYRGASAGSEAEIQVIEREGEKLRGKLILWMTWHTSGRIYLFPFGTVDSQEVCMVAEDVDDLRRVGEAGARAVEETYNEQTWTSDSTCEGMYMASAITQDWAYGTGLAKYSYTPELRGPGHDVSPTNIRPSVEENWNGLVAMITEIEAIEGI